MAGRMVLWAMSRAPQHLARLSGEISTQGDSYHDELAKLRREDKKRRGERTAAGTFRKNRQLKKTEARGDPWLSRSSMTSSFADGSEQGSFADRLRSKDDGLTLAPASLFSRIGGEFA